MEIEDYAKRFRENPRMLEVIKKLGSSIGYLLGIAPEELARRDKAFEQVSKEKKQEDEGK